MFLVESKPVPKNPRHFKWTGPGNERIQNSNYERFTLPYGPLGHQQNWTGKWRPYQVVSTKLGSIRDLPMDLNSREKLGLSYNKEEEKTRDTGLTSLIGSPTVKGVPGSQ